MSLTLFQNHETGTLNVNGIINGNWDVLNDLLDPALDSADPLFGLIGAAVGSQRALTTITYADPFDVSLLNRTNLCTLTGDAAVTVSNKRAGRFVDLVLVASGADRAVTWPAGAVWAGPALATVVSGTAVLVRIIATTGADAGLVLAIGGVAYTAGTGLTLTAGAFALDPALAGITRFALAAGAYVAVTADRALTDADNGKILYNTGGTDWTLTFSNSLTLPFSCGLEQESTGALIIAAGTGAAATGYTAGDRTAGAGAGASLHCRTGWNYSVRGEIA